MKTKALSNRIPAALLALAMLLTLLPAAALAAQETGTDVPTIHVIFSSNPNKRTALPLTLTEGDQLSIDGFAIETVLGPKGNPLISSGALAAVATLTDEQVQALTNEQKRALTEGTPYIQISSDGRYISYPAQGAAGGEEGLSDADFALLDAVRKGMNNPNYSWQDLLDYVKQVMDNDGSAYNMMAEHWGIPAETIKELMGDDNTAAFLDAWIGNRDDAMNADMLGEYMKDRENVQAHLNINSQTFTLGINGQTFAVGVNGETVAILRTQIASDNAATPATPTGGGSVEPADRTVLVVTGNYYGADVPKIDTITENEIIDKAATTNVPSADEARRALKVVTVLVHTTTGTSTVRGVLYQDDVLNYTGDATDKRDGTWEVVWTDASSTGGLNLANGFTEIKIYENNSVSPTYTITNAAQITTSSAPLRAVMKKTMAVSSAPALAPEAAPEAATPEGAAIPTDPTEPTNPTDPTDPTDPTEPTDPVNP